MAYIQVLCGNYDAALDEVGLLLSIPSQTSMDWFLADPIWGPVRNHPRFVQFLAES
ncbi:MAG: hypothetical protein IIA59_01565 [Candidatus Marinimicrobia bacterium]|nr:hypothetical protein [Candidatus Neomarinimicrobiota bacterium]